MDGRAADGGRRAWRGPRDFRGQHRDHLGLELLLRLLQVDLPGGGGFTRYGHWAIAAAKARRAGKVCAARRGRPCPRRAHHFGEGLHHLVQSDDGAALEASVAASARWALLAGRGVLPAAASAPSSVPAGRLLPAVAMEACHSPALETKRIVKAGEDPEVRSV